VGESFEDLLKLPRAPAYFKPEQKEIYKQMGKLLHDSGLLKKVDVLSLEMLAVSIYNFREATQDLNDNGYRNKHDQVSPSVTIQQTAMKQVESFSRRFGMSVNDRHKMRDVMGKSDPDQGDLFNSHVGSHPGNQSGGGLEAV
jgi:P27 family predicted phage terminase small subunit